MWSDEANPDEVYYSCLKRDLYEMRRMKEPDFRLKAASTMKKAV